MKHEKILLSHGAGGFLSSELIAKKFLPLFTNSYLDRMQDSAILNIGGTRLCFTTDSYVVNPIFFPGGDIGSLAVHGTVNDLCVCGAKPLFLSVGFILEEGFSMDDLEKIIKSMAEAAKKAGVKIVTVDTKVVARGAADKIFINTSGVGIIEYEGTISTSSIMPGDVIILNGTIGDHGAAILCSREGLGLKSEILSDSAPLSSIVQKILKASPNIHCMRDATRGGLGAILAEIAKQSKTLITVKENAIPVRDEVRGICEILGLDPVYIANQGKLVVFCPEQDAPKALKAMKKHPYGKNAAIIGKVEEKGSGRVIMKTVIGGSREIDLPTGELVPRIC